MSLYGAGSVRSKYKPVCSLMTDKAISSKWLQLMDDDDAKTKYNVSFNPKMSLYGVTISSLRLLETTVYFHRRNHPPQLATD
eukprot:scaffold214522_cov60-Attheya_sp.AAC.1